MKEERDLLVREEKRKLKKGKYIILIAEMLAVLSLITIALTVYTLCHVCITLCNTGYEELCAAIKMGAIFMFIICGFVGLFSIALKELREKNRL